MYQTLNGKTALITGASSGIGAATARLFAKLGLKQVLLARRTDKLERLKEEISQLGAKAEILPCDVSRFDDVQGAVDHALTHFGRIDILVNNAGAIDPITHLADSDPDEWCRVVDTNYKGVYFGMRAVLPTMLAQQSGTIINVSSGAATSALEGWSHYCSSKAAALSLTRCADTEYRDQGIKVIGISPGTVATDMQVAIKQSGINPVSQLDPSVHIPADIPAKAIAWLCTEHGHDYAGTDFALKAEGNIEKITQSFDR